MNNFCIDTSFHAAWDVKWMSNELLRLSAMSFMKPNKWFMYNIPDLLGEEKDFCVWFLFTLSPKASDGFLFIFEQMQRVDGWIRGGNASRQVGSSVALPGSDSKPLKYQNRCTVQDKLRSEQSELRATFRKSAVDGEHQGPKASKIQ